MLSLIAALSHPLTHYDVHYCFAYIVRADHSTEDSVLAYRLKCSPHTHLDPWLHNPFKNHQILKQFSFSEFHIIRSLPSNHQYSLSRIFSIVPSHLSMHFVRKPQPVLTHPLLVESSPITSTTDSLHSPTEAAARMLKRQLSSMVDFDTAAALSHHHSHHLAMDDLDDHYDQLHLPSKKSKGKLQNFSFSSLLFLIIFIVSLFLSISVYCL